MQSAMIVAPVIQTLVVDQGHCGVGHFVDRHVGDVALHRDVDVKP
jgi:hypothetical protein